jgi:uncharacterized protein
VQRPFEAPAAVLDTNVVLDWLVFKDAGVQALAAAVQSGTLRWLACARMRDELADVLARPQLQHWQTDVAAALAAFDRHAALRPAPPPSHLPCRDADDQVFIDLALAAGCRWLLTKDRALLALARRARPRGLLVQTPAAWLARQEKEAAEAASL